MHLDVALAQSSVSAGKIEVAHFAPEAMAATLHIVDLQSSELRIPLAGEGPADEKPSLDGRGACLVNFVGLWREKLKFTRADAFFDGLRGLEHLGLAVGEGLDHEQGGLAAPGCLPRVQLVVRHEVCGLAADAVGRPEAGKSERFRTVDGERAKEFRQLVHLTIAGPQFTPAVLHDERSGQYKFVLSPRGRPHEPYRMSVRRAGGCVQRTARRVAHLVPSRCQWGLSPSVMVDCKMCLPLHDCKEGA